MSSKSQPQPTDAPSNKELAEMVNDLRADLEREKALRKKAETERDELQETVSHLQQEVTDIDDKASANRAKADAALSKGNKNKERITEIQSIELEKGFHIQYENIEFIEEDLDVDGDRIERFTNDDGEDYARLPGEVDPLERSGDSAMATADLLPIQQLARMDDDMLANATTKRPDHIAAKVWAERGKHDRSTLWNKGSSSVREYLDAGQLKTWIQINCERDDESLSDDYAKQLAGRTMDRLVALSKNRLHIQKRNRRKDGLQYKERRLILPSDSEIPGEGSPTPETNEVTS